MKHEKKARTVRLKSQVSDSPKAYVRGALTMSDSTGGRGDSNDKSS